MSDYINRGDVLETLEVLARNADHNFGSQTELIQFIADNIKSLDGIEIVRCADCKHKAMKDLDCYCRERAYPLTPSGYCERGEK